MAVKPNRTSRIARFARLALTVASMAFATASWASITSSENPSTDGSYTISWSAVPNAHSYQLYEDGTLVYDFTGTSWSASGKAAGDYEYTVGYCEYIFDEEMCFGSGFTALTVTVSPPSPTVSASFDESSIALGESVELTWSSSNASSCSGSPAIGSTSTSGTKTYTPSSAGTFSVKVTCKGAGGSASDTASVTVHAPPTVTASFGDSSITLGDDVELTWSSTNASACSGSPSIDSTATSGTETYTPTSAGSFKVTVTCTGAGGSAEATATVTVYRPPTVTAEFDESSITLGDDVELSWESTDATACSGSPAIGSTATSGTKDYTPTSADTFSVTVTCTGAGGSAEATATVTVYRPPTVTAEFDESSITLGDDVELSWESTDATACSGSPAIGSTATSGTKDYTPTSAGTFSVTVTCTGAGGSASDTASVTVYKPVEVDAEFGASSITLGNSVRLSWSSTNASACSGSPAIGSTATSGTKDYTPTSAGTFSVTVTCTGAGGSASDTARVTVYEPPDVDADFGQSSITLGESVELSWSSNHATRCSGSPAIGSTSTSGTKDYTPTSAGTFSVTVTCTGPGGSDSDRDSVTVKPSAPTLTVPSASSDGRYTVSWTSVSGTTVYKLQEKSGNGRFKDVYSGSSTSTSITGKTDGTYSYQARACAGAGNCGDWSSTESVEVSINHAPVAVDDTARTPFRTAVVVSVLDNDTDADGDDLTVMAVTTPDDGAVTITTDDDGDDTQVTYTPQSGHPGTDTFDYTVSDGTASDTGTVTMTVDLVMVTPNPSTTGSYTLAWDGSPLLADRYRVLESFAGGTPSSSYHQGTSVYYSGKASGNYYYLVERCETPLGELEECVDLGRATARVVLAPTLTVPAMDPDGDYTATWTSVTGATSYELEEQPPGGSFGNIYDGDGTTHDITDNTPGIYMYRARACVGEGDCGGWSSTETTKVVPGVPTLTVPATDPDGDYATTWTSVTGATSYELEEQPLGGSFDNIYDEDGTTHDITDSPPGIYMYRVRACAGEGNCGDWSPTGTTKVPPGVPTLTVPSTDADGDYAASWTSVVGATSYELEDQPLGGSFDNIYDEDGTTHDITDSPPGIYMYRVRACAGEGNCGDWSPTGTTKVPPGVPTLTVPSVDRDGSYSAMWTSPSGATSYRFQEKSGSDAWSKSETLTATLKSYTTNTPAIYKYRVQACAGEGNCGGWSSIEMTKVPPGAPTLTVPPTDADGSYDATWTSPSGATGYKLREKVGSGAWSEPESLTATSKSYTTNTPEIYWYRVQACAGEGNCGGWSSTGTTKVPPGAPMLTVPPTDADGDYAVTWTQPSGATSYELEEKPAGGTFKNIYGGESVSTNITDRANGTYTYRAKACAGRGNCGDWSATGSVSVARTSQPPVTPNTAPVAVDDAAETPFETAVVIAVLDNDTDADGDDLTVLTVTAPADGTATVTGDANGNNTLVTYTPRFNNPGTDVFEYTVSDGTATDTGSVGVRVNRVTVTPNPSTTGIYTLSWSRTRADKYKVFESTDGGTTYTLPREYLTNRVQYTGKASGDYSYMVHHCEVPLEDPGGETCSLLGSADVTVLLPPEPTIETGALVVPGNLPYSAGVTKGGDAYVTVPIEPAPGVNGLVPRLAINYGGGRERQRDTESLPGDTLGYGWHLSGFSSVRRCAKNQPGDAAVRMTNADGLCLDGEPLVLKSGTHFAENAEYRTLRESYRKIVLKGVGFNTWFEITGPDGTVSEYGRTADSRLRNVEYVEVDGISSPVFTAPFLWSVNKQTDAFGNKMVYAYHEDELAGVRYPQEIRYGDDGDARLLFEYVARSDLAAVTLASVSQETRVLLHTVRAVLDAHSVRTYRMKSETASGRRQLDKIQLCGFAEDSGTSYKCLRPLDIDWEAPPISLPVDKVLLAKIKDPLGRETAFDYGTLTTDATHDFLFTERPFGNAATPANAAEVTTDTGTAIRAVVTAVRRSNGIGGEHTTSYAYQGKGYDSTRNWGFLGFPATRVTDGASGIVTYYQYRLDFPYYAELAAVRQYDGVYDAVSGSADTFDEKLLFRQELAYARESLSHGSVLPYVEKTVEFHYEGGKQIGLTQTESSLTLTGGFPTQLTRTTRTAHGETHSGGGTPWGALPTYTLSEEQRKATTTTKFTNRTSGGKWLIGFANEIRRSDFAGGSSTATRERRTTFTHHSSSNRVDTMERFPADSSTTPPTPADTEHYLKTVYAYDTSGNHFSTMVSGANVVSRTSRALFDADEARYPRALRNALGQEHSLVHDRRFGLVKRATDPNNRTTILAYDPFGREKSRTTPDNVTIATSHEWCGTGANKVTCATVGTIEPVARVRTSSPIHPTETRYLDKLGRVIRTELESFDGTTERREDIVYDARGRENRVSQPYHTGDTAYYTDYTYDIRDRVTRVERPDGGDTAIVYAVNPDQTEPDRDHQVRVTVTEKVYESTELASTHIKRSLYNVLGELIETTDGAGSAASAKDHVVTTYGYDGSGLLKTATVTGDTTANTDGTTSTVTNTTTFEYDLAGARDSVASPNFGTVTFEHTGLGQLMKQTDSEGETSYVYDKLGRLTTKKDPDGFARWSYDPANAVGALGSRCYHASDCADLPQPDFRETLTYRTDARLETSTVDIRAGGHVKDYAYSYTYDTSGRPATVTYPSGLIVRTDYNARGYRSGLTDVTDSENPVALETFDAMNAYGQISRQTFGNGAETARAFDAASGRLRGIDTTRGAAKIQDSTYAWRTNGILSSRLDESGATAKGETFAYDALDRLKSATTQLGDQSATMNPAERTLSYAYDKLGNLRGRTSSVSADNGLSGTSFGDGTAAPGPNALTAATIGGDAYALRHDTGGKVYRYDDTAGGDDTLIGWNGRSLPETIDVASDAGPVSGEAFAYGPDGQRYHRKSVWKDGDATRTEHTFYAGAFEERLLDGHARFASVQKTRVGASIVEVRTLSHPDPANNNRQTAASSLEYLHRDHLGSVEAVTDASGARLATLAYDPFGARRKPDWTRSLNSGEIESLADDLKLKVSRGYSDHEHLDRAGFIHMNGRVYDPRTGRFLSPDPIVEDPAFSQSWHSYSYVANSPLSLVDPTGLAFAPCPMSRPVNMGGYCAPADSLGGFGGKIQTIISNIHRVRFEIFVYDTLVFGSTGDIPGEREYVFDVISVIRVFVSVESETVEHDVPVDDKSETDEPMDALPSSAATGGQIATTIIASEGIGADAARKSYKRHVEALDPNDSIGRKAAKEEARRRTPPLTRAVLETARPDTGPRPGSVGHADRTNPGADKGAKVLGHVGRASAVGSVVLGGVRIYNAPDKARESVIVLSEAGGAVSGAWVGGLAGCAVAPGPGCAVGAIVGGVVGGIGAGEAAERIYDSSQ